MAWRRQAILTTEGPRLVCLFSVCVCFRERRGARGQLLLLPGSMLTPSWGSVHARHFGMEEEEEGWTFWRSYDPAFFGPAASSVAVPPTFGSIAQAGRFRFGWC